MGGEHHLHGHLSGTETDDQLLTIIRILPQNKYSNNNKIKSGDHHRGGHTTTLKSEVTSDHLNIQE
jgi:hypothetical protein